MVNSLASRGVDEAIISMACTICTSKEEALLFLGIPTIYKSQPISDIPIKYIIPNSSSIDTSSNIHKELLDTGAPLEVDENLSLSFEILGNLTWIDALRPVPTLVGHVVKYPK